MRSVGTRGTECIVIAASRSRLEATFSLAGHGEGPDFSFLFVDEWNKSSTSKGFTKTSSACGRIAAIARRDRP
jgi:hypothetical protein